VGRSGTGKTTIAKELFSDFIVEKYTYNHECLLDDFPKGASMQEIYKALNSVGFSSPPLMVKILSCIKQWRKNAV
jgi:uridine kinase